MKKLYVLTFLCLISLNAMNLLAQSVIVKGSVTDDNGEPMIGVAVVVEGTTKGAITDVDGKFSVGDMTIGEKLKFSMIGYQSVVLEVLNESPLSVVLKEDVGRLDEVVVVGYGVMKKSDVTGSTDRLTQDRLNTAISSTPTEMLQGRSAGVTITRTSGEPGAGVNVRIRGAQSVRAGQDPLYVVDGVPLDNSDLTPKGMDASGVNGSTNKDPLSFLNPSDIESIDILKDASATAIYGARGANGVVLITTKKGKQGKGQIEYDGYLAFLSLPQKVDVLSAEQYKEVNSSDPSRDFGSSTDWQDQIYRNAVSQNHNVSYRGGTENSTYRASLGYMDQEGIIKKTSQNKLVANASITQELFEDKLKLSAVLSASQIKDNRVPIAETGGHEGDVIGGALKANPTQPVYNADGSFYQRSAIDRNPLAMIELTDDETVTDRVFLNMSADLKLLKDLSYKFNLGYDNANVERIINQDASLIYMSNGGKADLRYVKSNSILSESFFTYTKTFNKVHSLTALAGYAYQKFNYSLKTMGVDGFEKSSIKYSDRLEYGNYSTATVYSEANENELQSFFGRLNYAYNSKHLFTATLRRDGSTKFGENNKYGTFPSFAYAWRAGEESFVQNWNVFSDLKFRLGWGMTGNQEIGNKLSQASIGTQPDMNEVDNTGYGLIRTPNPDLKWETTAQTNIGLDFGLWTQRFYGSVDYFHKVTSDVLMRVPTYSPAPTRYMMINVEDMEIVNNGVELSLTGLAIDKKDLQLEFTSNVSFLNNEIRDMPVPIETGTMSGAGLSASYCQRLASGYSLGTFYVYEFQGFEDGVAKYSDEKIMAESALPDVTYSLTAKVNYKNFDFSMFWYGMNGNYVYNNTKNAFFNTARMKAGSNVSPDIAYSTDNIEVTPSTYYLEDGSFLRLENITLGYTFNTNKISWLSSARVYVTGNNLLLITGYSGIDPEVNNDAAREGVPSMGIDYTSYPRSRSFTFGVNVQF
ncbi:MAG: SusC/RagA family TonB-linked outer membrane protein [Bacteroidales bacterium]